MLCERQPRGVRAAGTESSLWAEWLGWGWSWVVPQAVDRSKARPRAGARGTVPCAGWEGKSPAAWNPVEGGFSVLGNFSFSRTALI